MKLRDFVIAAWQICADSDTNNDTNNDTGEGDGRLPDEVARPERALPLRDERCESCMPAGMEGTARFGLGQAVSHDSNVNVRLAAIDALSKVATHPGVVDSLTRSLPRQDSPMVQAALIDYLVDAHDRQAVGMLRQLASRPDLNPAVLERTHFALQQLTH